MIVKKFFSLKLHIKQVHVLYTPKLMSWNFNKTTAIHPVVFKRSPFAFFTKFPIVDKIKISFIKKKASINLDT